jgi:chemotaxis protein MotB
MAKRKEPPAEEGSPAWMATFSDLMNLLLCFFVLLFASSTMDEGKIQQIAASFDNISFSVIDTASFSLVEGEMMSAGVTQVPDVEGILTEAGKNVEGESGDTVNVKDSTSEKHIAEDTDEETDLTESITTEITTEATTEETAAELDEEEINKAFQQNGEEQSEEMYEEVVEMAESYSIEDQMLIDYNAQYVELDLQGSILFDSGSAEVKEEAKELLTKIASILEKYKTSIIEIEGHTDNVPISSAKYENNRELSTERARKVYEYLDTQGDFVDSNMKIAGYGESKPVATNSTEEGRARNRRVVIKIYNQQNSIQY